MKNRTRNLKLQLCKPEFRVFLFFLALVLFNSPLLTIAEDLVPEGYSAALFLYLFLSWGVMVLLLFFAAASCNSWDSTGTTEDSEE